MWQNSMVFTEMLSGTDVTRSFQCAAAVRMVLHAELQEREEFVDLLLCEGCSTTYISGTTV